MTLFLNEKRFFHSVRPVVSFWYCYSSLTIVKLFFLKFHKFTLSCSSFIMKLTPRLRNLNWSFSFCTLNKCWCSLVDSSQSLAPDAIPDWSHLWKSPFLWFPVYGWLLYSSCVLTSITFCISCKQLKINNSV